MPAKSQKPVALIRGIYKVNSTTNDLIRDGDAFKGRLRDDDWAIFLGQAEYMVVEVNGYEVTAHETRSYRFRASPVGVPLRWVPTEQDFYRLMAGEKVTAPVDLSTQIQADSSTDTSEPSLRTRRHERPLFPATPEPNADGAEAAGRGA